MASKSPKKANLPVPAPENVSEVPSVYVNNFEVLGLSPFDLRIAFNEMQSERDGTVKMVRKANLVMSVPHFVATVELLNTVLADLAKKSKLKTSTNG